MLARGAVLVRAMDGLRLDEREARRLAEAAQLQLAEQNARLKELDSLKDEFVGLVSHELRTPLTSISGYLELLEDPETGPLNDEQREFLAIVERNARQAPHARQRPAVRRAARGRPARPEARRRSTSPRS